MVVWEIYRTCDIVAWIAYKWHRTCRIVELGEILGPPHLPLGQYLGSRKILKVLIIHNNVNGIGWTFQIVSPNLESFEWQAIPCHVCRSSTPLQWKCESKRQLDELYIFVNNGEDCSESIVWGISFHNKLSIRNPMSENRSRGKCFLERVESISTGGVELPRNVLLDEICQWNDNVQVVEDEPAVKVCKT